MHNSNKFTPESRNPKQTTYINERLHSKIIFNSTFLTSQRYKTCCPNKWHKIYFRFALSRILNVFQSLLFIVRHDSCKCEQFYAYKYHVMQRVVLQHCDITCQRSPVESSQFCQQLIAVLYTVMRMFIWTHVQTTSNKKHAAWHYLSIQSLI